MRDIYDIVAQPDWFKLDTMYATILVLETSPSTTSFPNMYMSGRFVRAKSWGPLALSSCSAYNQLIQLIYDHCTEYNKLVQHAMDNKDIPEISSSRYYRYSMCGALQLIISRMNELREMLINDKFKSILEAVTAESSGAKIKSVFDDFKKEADKFSNMVERSSVDMSNPFWKLEAFDFTTLEKISDLGRFKKVTTKPNGDGYIVAADAAKMSDIGTLFKTFGSFVVKYQDVISWKIQDAFRILVRLDMDKYDKQKIGPIGEYNTVVDGLAKHFKRIKETTDTGPISDIISPFIAALLTSNNVTFKKKSTVLLDEMIIHCIAMCKIMKWVDEVIIECGKVDGNPSQFDPSDITTPFCELFDSAKKLTIDTYAIDLYMQYIRRSLYDCANINNLYERTNPTML